MKIKNLVRKSILEIKNTKNLKQKLLPKSLPSPSMIRNCKDLDRYQKGRRAIFNHIVIKYPAFPVVLPLTIGASCLAIALGLGCLLNSNSIHLKSRITIFLLNTQFFWAISVFLFLSMSCFISSIKSLMKLPFLSSEKHLTQEELSDIHFTLMHFMRARYTRLNTQETEKAITTELHQLNFTPDSINHTTLNPFFQTSAAV